MNCFPSWSEGWYVGQGRRWRRRAVKLDRCWERDMCFSCAAPEIGGERKGEGEKGQVKYFPLWQRKWGKVERASSVLRNGLNHSRRGCWNSQPHRPLSKCTYQWWMILTFTPSAFSSLLSTAQGGLLCVFVWVCTTNTPHARQSWPGLLETPGE